MEKVKTMQEAYRVFELLGIKEVTKKWQKAKGTEVWELPQKTMLYNGHGEINRFTIYRNGYVRKMIVNGNTNASNSCYQLNLVRKVPNYIKDYDYLKVNDDTNEFTWTGKYRKVYNRERIMIDNHRDRVVYLCNYILKNYYRSQTGAGFYRINDYQVSLMQNATFNCESETFTKDLPFEETVERDSFIDDNEIKVIINGHRYNLS